MNRIVLAIVFCASLLMSAASASAAERSIALQIGAIRAYEYPLDPAKENAVSSETSAPILSLRANSTIAARWQVTVAAQYWAGDGLVGLAKIPEAPGKHVDTRLVPLSAGVRFQPGPLNQSVRLYVGLAPTLAILHTQVTSTGAPEETSDLGSATYLAPAATADVALDFSLSSRFGLQFTIMYLLSSGFNNTDQLIVNRNFDGISEFIALGGLRFRIF